MSLPSNILLLFNILIMRTIFLGLTLLSMYPAQAMSDAHQQGMSLAQSTSLPQPGNPEKVPGYAGTNLPQSQIKPHDLGEAALNASRSSEASQLIAERLENGEMYVIDPHTDSLILAGNQVVNNPQKTLDDAIIEDEEGKRGRYEGKAENISCEESGDETLEEGEEIRVVEVKEPTRLDKHRVTVAVNCFPGAISGNVITGQGFNVPPYYHITTSTLFPTNLTNRVDHVEMLPPSYSTWHVSAVTCSPDGAFYAARAGGKGGIKTLAPFGVNFDVFYKALPSEEDVSETIENKCHYWEEQVEKGLCSYEDMVVIEGPQTRVINGYAVTRDWWRRKKIYRCHYPAKNDCEALRAKGCYQVNSACKEKVRDVCVVWQQTYKCPSKKIGGKSYRSSNKDNPFCLSGDCFDKSYEPNNDFAEVMSHMSVLKEAGDDFTKFGMIFRGNARKCTRHCVDFKDCCGNGNGWGVSLKLSSCDADEKELAELRKKKRCIQVGTYCAEKVLGVCIRKKTSFCCYDTKLAKIVQEQGKGQLKLGFGSPKEPQCQGLTPEQLSKIDFSQINFSDIFSDIVANTRVPNPEAITQGIQKSMANKGSLLKPSVKGLQEKPVTSIQPQPSVESSAASNSEAGENSQPVVSSILNSPSASAMDDDFDTSPEEETRTWKQLVKERSATAIRSEDNRKKTTSVKKGAFGGKSTFSAYDDDFGITPISPIVKPVARPNIAQKSIIGKEEHVSKTLPDSLLKSGNHQIQGHACQGRNHGEF